MSVFCMRSPRGRAFRGFAAAVVILAALAAISPSARTEEPAVWAIINARVIPVSSPALEKGTIVIRDGIIEAVGASVAVPGDARVIDGAGLTVYPGFIDALSDIGLEDARSQQAQSAQRPSVAPATPGRPDMPGQQASQPPSEVSEESRGLTPYRQAVEIISSANRKVESARNAGITTTMVAPRNGFFPGQSSIIDLSGGGTSHMVVKTPVAFHINLSQARGFGRGYPSVLMGIIAFVKQTLMDAQRYDIVWTQYRATPGVPRPEYSESLEALQPALKRQMPVVIPGNTPTEIERALAIADEFNLNPILSGGMEAGPVAALLKQKGVPVLLSVKFAERERDADPEAREELDALRRRIEAPANASALAKAGIRFAFVSDDTANPRDFIRNVGRTVEAGLDRQAALRALTLTPAEILGIADRFGSIEKNKTANLVLATGDIFQPATRVRYTFVDGQRFEVPESETPPERPERPAGAPASERTAALDFSGTWNLVVNSPQGPVDVTLTIQHTAGTIRGTVSSMLGTSEIYDGTASDNRISFKVSISPPGMDSMEILFSGSIQGNQISGTASVGDMGNMDFTGSKKPADY